MGLIRGRRPGRTGIVWTVPLVLLVMLGGCSSGSDDGSDPGETAISCQDVLADLERHTERAFITLSEEDVSDVTRESLEDRAAELRSLVQDLCSDAEIEEAFVDVRLRE